MAPCKRFELPASEEDDLMLANTPLTVLAKALEDRKFDTFNEEHLRMLRQALIWDALNRYDDPGLFVRIEWFWSEISELDLTDDVLSVIKQRVPAGSCNAAYLKDDHCVMSLTSSTTFAL